MQYKCYNISCRCTSHVALFSLKAKSKKIAELVHVFHQTSYE